MFLVPQHQIDLVRNNTARPSLRESVQNDLDEKMRAILADTQDNAYNKARRYSSVLQRFLALARQEEREASTPLPARTTPDAVQENSDRRSSDSIITEILKNIPKNSKTKARYILEKMSESPHIASWNKEGEVILNNHRIAGTHLFDLIKNITSTQIVSDKRKPKAWDEYLEALSQLNVPLSLITNLSARNAVENFKAGQQDSPVEASFYDKVRKPRGRRRKVWDEKEWVNY